MKRVDSSTESWTPGRRCPWGQRWLLAVLAALGLVALAGCQRAPAKNLILISIDTTRADRLGAYGYEGAATPNMDALAERGFLFRRHLTPVPITLPAHTSLMTGLFPPTHTVRDNVAFTVPQDAVTLAEVLRDVGYDTSAFVGSFPLAAEFGLDQGFDRYDDDLRRPGSGSNERFDIYFDERPAGAVIDAATAYHETREASSPYFSFIHFFDPHQPQIPPAPYDVTFRHQPYDGELAYVDEQIGRFLAFLEARGDLENTVVVVTADHGEGLGEHGEATHAMLLHQATLHIPLIMAGSGIPAGETRAWTASTQVFRTLLDLLGVATPELEESPGHSLKPLIENDGVPPAGWPRFTAYFETLAPRASQGWSQLTAWMKDDWRLVHGPNPDLFDLDADPRENTNRFAEQPQIASGLFKELAAFLASNETASVGDAVQEVDQETADRLAALGYLRGGVDELSSLSDILDVEGLLDPKARVADISLFSEAKGALARQEFDLARSLHEELIRRSPENGWAYAGLGMVYGRLGDLETALTYFDKAIEFSDDLQFQGQRATILIDLDRHQEGIDGLLAMPEPASRADSCTWLGIAYRALGNEDEAMAWFRKGLVVAPDDSWLRLYVANGLASRGDLDEAEPLYRSIIADDPYFPLAYFNYGKLLTDRGDTDAALGVLRRSATLNPDHERTRIALRNLEEGRAFPSSGEASPVPTTPGAAGTAGTRGAALATFDGGTVTVADLDTYLLSLPVGERKPAEGQSFEAWIRQRVEILVEQRLLVQATRLAALEGDPDFEAAWERRRPAVLAEAFVNRTRNQVSVTREEAEAYFEKHRDAVAAPERRAVLNLLLAFEPGADPAAQDEVCTRAESLREEIVRGASFETLALRHSDSSTAGSGGLIGAVRREDLRGDVGALIFELEPGEVSQVLRNAAGCQMFMVKEVLPATAPTFESRSKEIVDNLRSIALDQALKELRDREAEALGFTLPDIDRAALRDMGPEEVIVDIAGEAVTAGDLQAAAQRGNDPVATLRGLVDQRLVAAALRRESPDDAARLLRRARLDWARAYQRQRDHKETSGAVSAETLRAYYDDNQPRFVTDPRAELIDVSWPLGDGDPHAAMATPRAFMAVVEGGEAFEAAWSRVENDPGVTRRVVPLASVRQLALQNRGLSRLLVQPFREGDVLGPIRVGDRLHVVYAETFVPPRQLGFVEAQDRVRAMYTRDHAGEIESAWRDALFEEAGVKMDEEQLARFGEGLIDRLTRAGG